MKSPMSEETKAKIIEARREGKEYGEIATMFGLSRPYVNNICIQAGLPKQERNCPKRTRTKTCPNCHKNNIPTNYSYCPYCGADIRDEKTIIIESLKHAIEQLRLLHGDIYPIQDAMLDAIKYLESIYVRRTSE